jgi:hypothetical protein
LFGAEPNSDGFREELNPSCNCGRREHSSLSRKSMMAFPGASTSTTITGFGMTSASPETGSPQ